MPLCAHEALRQKAFKWLPEEDGNAKEKRRLRDIRKLMKDIQAVNVQRNKDDHKQAQAEWQARCDRAPDRTPPIGMDHEVEVPPIDTRDWCNACLVMEAFNILEEKEVRDAEEAAENKTDQQKRIYNVNPLSHDDQHSPMLSDGFSQSPLEHQHTFQGPLAGPYTYSFDALTNSRWDLFTHAAFHTWPHHDGSGMSTWVRICEGCKIWAPVIPNLPENGIFTKHDLFDATRKILQPAPHVGFQDHSKSLCMFLLPDDVL